MNRKERQALVLDWCERAFGRDVARDRVERSARVLEEATELAQAVGLPASSAIELVRVVYERDRGRVHQEIGGVSITLLALCEAFGCDADAEEFRELRRILDKPLEHFRARQAEKSALGVALPSKHEATPCEHEGKR